MNYDILYTCWRGLEYFTLWEVMAVQEDEFQAVVLCQALGSTTRYRILKLLAARRMRPGQLASTLGKSKTVISVHLAKLRAAGLVRFKREATGLLYWLKPTGLKTVLGRLEAFAASLKQRA